MRCRSTTVARPAPVTTVANRTATARRRAATASSTRRELRHGDPARHARRLPGHGRLPARDVRRQSPSDLEQHVLGCLQLESDRRAVGQGHRQLLPSRRHSRQRHRLPDRVWQRRLGDGYRRRALRPGNPTGVMGALPDELRRRRRLQHRLLRDQRMPGCSATALRITTPISGDGCCPPGATNATDDDCPPSCGNGVVERGERCDGDSCPTTCPVPPPGILGRRGACSTWSWVIPICARRTARSPQSMRATRTKKTAAAPRAARPTTIPIARRRAATASSRRRWAKNATQAWSARAVGARPRATTRSHARTTTWSARGRVTRGAYICPSPITVPAMAAAFRARRPYLDPDCPSTCGDGIVDRPTEICDFGVGAGCPTSETCQSKDKCTTYALTGRSDFCSAACVATPITACVGGDLCCPPGCTAVDDSDCPAICGDGVVETSERCDRAITAGQPGACDRTCDDGDACTFDQASGSVEGCSRACSHAHHRLYPERRLLPGACSAENDSDCAPKCGDNRVGAGETCDPPSSSRPPARTMAIRARPSS